MHVSSHICNDKANDQMKLNTLYIDELTIKSNSLFS
jgi:hypothetical protein